MDVFQVPATRHPLLSALYVLLRGAPTPDRPPVVNELLRRHLDAGPPVRDLPEPPGSLREAKRLPALAEAADRLLSERWPGVPITTRAVNYYPAGGGLGWHTNSNLPGWRAYVVRTPPSPRSRFLVAEGAIPDRDGVVNLFRAGPAAWHAVDAATERWSLGVRIPDELAHELQRLGLPAAVIPWEAR